MTRSVSLWVDDKAERDPADPNWLIARTAETAIAVLSQMKVDRLSLDFDLGPSGTVEPLLNWMEQAAHHGLRPPKTMLAHSQNPVGRNLINLVYGQVLSAAADFDARSRWSEDAYAFEREEPPLDDEE